MTERLLLTVREVAELLGIRPGSVYHWVSQGRLPCVRLSSRCLRFRAEEIQRLIAEMSESERRSPRDRSSGVDVDLPPRKVVTNKTEKESEQ
jgi:excisionase family DNA binding protein